MIHETTTNAIGVLSDRLANAGVGIAPIDATVLGACVQASNTPVLDGYDADTGWTQAWVDSLGHQPLHVGSSSIAGEGDTTIIIPTSQHDSTMDKAIEVTANAALTALSHARNVAKPAISTFIDSVSEKLTDYMATTEPLEIVDMSDLDVWDSAVVQAALNRYSGYKNVPPLPRSAIPQIQVPANAGDYYNTGIASVDSVIRELADSLDMSAAAVLDSIFNSKDNFAEFPRDLYATRDLRLLQLLISSVLVDRPIPGSGLDTDQWANVCTQLCNTLGAMCFQINRYIKEETDNDVVIVGVDSTAGKINVNTRNYKKLLAQGVTPETIYGGWLKERSMSKLDAKSLLQNKEAYINEWQSYHAMQQQKSETEYLAKFKLLALESMRDLVINTNEQDLPPNATYESLINVAREKLQKLRPAQLSELGVCSIHLVCDVLFPHTPAKHLLLRINDLVVGGKSGGEAAAIAITEYITDWVADSIQVE